jgi:hypothetical protein
VTDFDALYRELDKALNSIQNAHIDAGAVEHDAASWPVAQAADIENAANEAASALDSLADLLVAAMEDVPPSGGGG